MALSGTMVEKTSIKADGDAFLDIFSYKPYTIPDMSPLNIKGVALQDGEWGSVGSIINWNYNHAGAECVAKEVIEAIDADKKLVCYKVVDGTIMEHYKSFFLTIHVDTKERNTLVTWTLTYEKLNESVEDPNTLMEFCLNVTKDIDAHQNI